FLLRQWDCVKEGLHRGLAEAPAALMWSPLVVVDEPDVEVGLQLLNRLVDLLAEGDPVELVEDGAMEALANTIGLRALGLGAAVVDVLDGQIELVLVALGAAKLGPAIGQHARQRDAVLVVKRHHPVIEDLGRGDRGLAIVEFGKGNFGIGVDKSLLIDPPDALERSDIEGVLRAAVARAALSNSPCASLSALAFSSAVICASVSRMPSCATLASSALRRCFIEVQIVALPHAAHPGRRDRHSAPLEHL